MTQRRDRHGQKIIQVLPLCQPSIVFSRSNRENSDADNTGGTYTSCAADSSCESECQFNQPVDLSSSSDADNLSINPHPNSNSFARFNRFERNPGHRCEQPPRPLSENLRGRPRYTAHRGSSCDNSMDRATMEEAAAASSAPEFRKQKKKKVLLMGKSGSGKSSMRSIIFSNYVAKDTRRLGATIDVDLSHVKFLGNLTLNLWDCGGQDAFMESYLSQQRAHVFSNVGVLIYVFDVESRDFDRDLLTYRSIITALSQFSPSSTVYILVHKMDLIAPNLREDSYNDRIALIRSKSDAFDPMPFATSIWDQSLYKAWAEIIHDLVPNLTEIEKHLESLGNLIEAEEVLLFERASFLVVSSWSSPVGKQNPTHDRHERISNIIKNFKQSTSRYTGTPKSAEQFVLWDLKLNRFSMFIVKFTTNTYLAGVLPPGEERFNCAMENTKLARKEFENLDSPPRRGPDRGAGGTSATIEASGV